MKYAKQFLLLFFTATLWLACSSEEGASTAETPADTAADAKWKTSEQMKQSADSESSAASMDEISLKDGQKWIVNEEMKPHIEQAEQLLQDFLRKGKDNYDPLAEALQTKNTALIQSCTMKGQSHEELHKWLEPHLKLTKELAAADSPEEAQATVKELQSSFEVYHKYFD